MGSEKRNEGWMIDEATSLFERGKFLETECVFAGVGNVKETILILMLLINRTHQRSSRRKYLIDEDENGFLRRQLDALADHVHELTNGQISGYEILFFVNGGDVGFLDFLADYGDAVGVFLSNTLSFGLALLERVLVLELGSHIDRVWS